MRIFTKHFKRFIYLILSCLFCCLPASANFFPVEFTTSIAGIAPEAIDVKNFYIQNTSGISQILPLIGKDSDGTIVSFQILSIPNSGTQGQLYLSGVAVTVNQVLTLAQAKLLQFDPLASFNGNATFTYTVKDDEALIDATPATFSIPITNNSSLLVCSGGGLGANILGAAGTFSAPYITPNAVSNCINNGSTIAAPLQNLGDAKPVLTNYTYASTSNSLGPEGRYSFLKTLGTMATRNCIKTDWVASDHTGDGGYAMIVNGSPNSASFGETFYQASSIEVCPNTLYEFSAYVINVLPGNSPSALPGSEPNISFYINNLLVSNSGPITYAGAAASYVPQWIKVGGLWYSGPNTSVNLRIDNATFVASGNDLGLDDISMAICGPDITYPNISLTPEFCSYGVLPLKAQVKASINTYSSYIFQNSIDGGNNWTDMGNAKTGSPVFNPTLNTYEYLAEYGDIPIIPSMDGYRYRLKVATEASNLTGTTCNVSADKIITVSTMNVPAAGADIVGCNSAATANLTAALAGETWAIVAGNPTSAAIDQSGNVSGMTVNGIYKFQLSNTAGCSDTVNVTRDEIKSAGVDATVCSPETTLKLADAGSGYKWGIVSGNPGNATINPSTGAIAGLTADGIYHFLLRSDYGGCTDEVLVTKSTISFTHTKTDVLCFGTSTGSIDLSVSGGTGPYTYSWSGGQSIEDLSSLAAGNYSVTVTDSKGCSATLPVTISQPAALALTSTKTDVLCFGTSSGSINLNVTGGTAPYSYSWIGGITTQDLSILAAGTYDVTVTDASNCTATASVTITQPAAPLALTSTKTDVLCFGSSTGSINLNVSGGAAPYTYSWTGGISTKDLSGLTAGTYDVTVTDSNNCTATTSVGIKQPKALEVSVAKSDILCYGSNTGSIVLNVNGGTAPYTYRWKSGQTTKELTGLLPGNYSVIVTDAVNCSSSADVKISQPEPLKATLTVKNATCSNNDGTISTSISGGIKPYKIAWMGSTNLTGTVLKDVKAGSYQLFVTDAAGCIFSIKAEIAKENCSPVAQNDNFNIEQDKVLVGDVAPNDTNPQPDKLTFTKLSEPKSGKLNFDSDGKFVFTPDNGFAGTIEFSYQICNTSGACHTAKVIINVNAFTIVNLTPELSSVWEGKKIAVTARLVRPFKEDVTITIEYSGKAERERDYLVLDQYMSLKIPKGSLSTTEKMTIAALNDGLQEGDEDIIMKIKTVSNTDVHIGNGAVAIINDVYPPPPPTDVPQDEPINAEIVPDALMSPNGDGSGNEFFTIRNIESYPDNEVLIFNRWGNELFSIKNYNTSDRNFKGFANKGLLVNTDLPLSDGVYFYIINTYRTVGADRTRQVNKGYLILKR